MGIIWTAENHPNEIMDIEIRQGCFEVLDVLVNNRGYSAHVVLINEVRKLWKMAKEKGNIRQLDMYHIYAHGRGNYVDLWNGLADLIAKKAADGFISNGCGPFNIDKLDDNADEGKKCQGKRWRYR